MEKSLSDMTLEELWELFPIFLVEHDDKWKQYYDEMESFLKEILSDCKITRISHIGSTAICGIYAKNIVDILLEIDREEDMEKVAGLIESNGFVRMASDIGRISLNRGYTPSGFADRVYHLHIRYNGDNDELYFRDYLIEHPEIAKAYERLKLDLQKKYEHDRDSYTKAKTEFVKRYTREARKLYGSRY